MSQSGTSLSELTGLLTGAQTVLQNIEKVSSGLNTVSQRLRGMESAGEDGSASIAKLQDELSRINVNVLDEQTGQLRSTFDILQDLAKVYPTLSQNQKAFYTELISGKRQANVLIAILDGWEEVEKAVSAATNSVGSASQEQQAYLDSIQGKINQLQSAWSDFANSTISSGLIKGVVDFTTVLVRLADAIGGANIALGLMATLIGAKGGVIPIFNVWANKVAIQAAAVTGLKVKTTELTISATALGAAIQGVVVTFALWIASKILEYIDKVNVTIEEQREIVQNLQTELDGLRSEYEKLSEKDNLTEQEQRRLKILENELYLKRQLLDIEKKRQFDKEFTSGSGQDDVTTSDLFVADENGKDFINVDASIIKFEELQKTIADTETKLATTFDTAEVNKLNQKLSESQDELTQVSDDLTWVAKRFEEAKDMGYNFDGRMVGMADAVDDFLTHYEEVISVAIQVRQALEESSEGGANTYMKLSEVMSSLAKDTNLVSKAYKEMASNGQLSLETVLEIINAGGDLLDVLELENGQYRANMDMLDALFEKDKAVAKERIQNSIEEVKAKIKAVEAEIASQTVIKKVQVDTVKTSEEVAQANMDVAVSFAKGLGVQAVALGAFGNKMASKATKLNLVTAEQAKARTAELNSLTEELRQLELGLQVVSGEGLASYSGALDKSASSSDKLKNQTDKLNDALKEQETILDNLVEKYDNTKDAILDMIDSEIEALEKANELLGSYDVDDSLSNKYNIFKDYILQGLEDEIKAIEDTAEAEKKYWQDKIDAMEAEEEANERNKQLEEARLKISEAQAALDKAELARNQLQKNTRIYKEGEGWVWDYDPSAVKKADEDIANAKDSVQEAMDNLLELQEKFFREDIRKHYEEQIQAIEAETKAQVESVQKQIEALNELANSWGNNNAEILDEILSQTNAQQFLADFQNATDAERVAMLQQFSESYKTNVDDVIAKNQEEITNLESLRDNFEQKYDNMKQQLEGFIVDEQFLQEFENASYEQRQAMLESFTMSFQTEYQKQKDIVNSLASEVQRLTELSSQAASAASDIRSSVSQSEADAERLARIRSGLIKDSRPTLPNMYGNVGYKPSSNSSTTWKYANGGLIKPLQTKTGLDSASGNWFDGTQSKPELVLNDAQSGNILGALASTNAGKLYNLANNPMTTSVNNTTQNDSTLIGQVNVYPKDNDSFEKIIKQAKQMAQTKNR